MLPTIVHPSYNWGHLGQPVTWQKSMWGMRGKPWGVFVNCVGIKLIIKWNVSRLFHKYLGYMEICTLYMKNHWRVGAYLTAVSNLFWPPFAISLSRFLLGFFFIGVPWYVGAFIFCCLTHDYRERSGLAACAIAVLSFLLSLCSHYLPVVAVHKVLNYLSPTTSPLLLFQSS
jgi:hypothetical protein